MRKGLWFEPDSSRREHVIHCIQYPSLPAIHFTPLGEPSVPAILLFYQWVARQCDLSEPCAPHLLSLILEWSD
jgi:hypothetical protein